MEMVSPSEVTREHSAVNKIKSAILDHGNPFAVEGDRLHNMITHDCIPNEFVEQILNANDTGQKIYEDYSCVYTRANIVRAKYIPGYFSSDYIRVASTLHYAITLRTLAALT